MAGLIEKGFDVDTAHERALEARRAFLEKGPVRVAEVEGPVALSPVIVGAMHEEIKIQSHFVYVR